MTQPRASQFPGSLTEEEDDIEDVKPFGTAPLSIRITPPPEMDHIMEGQDDLSDWQQVEVDAVLSQASTESERSVLRAQRVGAGSRSMLNKLQAAAVAVDHNPEESHGVTVKQGKRKWTDGEANEGGGDAERTPRKSQWQSIQDDQVRRLIDISRVVLLTVVPAPRTIHSMLGTRLFNWPTVALSPQRPSLLIVTLETAHRLGMSSPPTRLSMPPPMRL
jgi:hypothetical protein